MWWLEAAAAAATRALERSQRRSSQRCAAAPAGLPGWLRLLSVASPWWVSNKSHKGSSCRRNAKLICNGH
eukprot:COSAG01_NODE_7245_length_3285_cov_2.517891_4_plen_69_part_01